MPEDQLAGKNLQRRRRRLLPAPWLSRRRRGEHGETPDRGRRPAVVAELHASTPARPEGAPDTRIWTAPSVLAVPQVRVPARWLFRAGAASIEIAGDRSSRAPQLTGGIPMYAA